MENAGGFTNKVIVKAINEYLNSKNNPDGITFNSFFIVAIRKLVLIYSELDLIMPIQTGNEEIFDANLARYGYPKERVKEFKNTIDRFNMNPSSEDYVAIEKMLIDMFMKKKVSIEVTEEEIKEFRDLVSSPYSKNPLIISNNFMMTDNPMELIEYFDKAVVENQKPVITKAKELLNLGAYEILKYSFEDVKGMNADQLDEVNKKIYAYFDINENAINKKYLLDKAVYDYNNPKASYSTGNGYVDILFFMSILATITMVIIVLTIILG